MHVTRIAPDAHDALVARISHLPHILASALSYQASKLPNAQTRLCGSGLRDTTRIAAGDPLLWNAIFTQNKAQVREAINEFEKHIQTFKQALDADDNQCLIELLEAAQQQRISLDS